MIDQKNGTIYKSITQVQGHLNYKKKEVNV